MPPWILNQRYQLQKRLSKKGARHTFIAKDLQTHQLVVVKVLLFGPSFQWQDHKLFERGAAALKTLSFPGIPQYLDYFDVDIGRHKGFAQVQSYIPARSLQSHIQAGRTFSEDNIRQLALQLLKILDYLHQRQPAVIHRDIKPSNILLSEEHTGNTIGQVHLVDFDSVKTGATRSDYTITIVGTYGYMPPEQFSGNAQPASDLYGLGATLIYAITGKHPADLPQKDMAIDFEANINPNLVAWLKSMTNPNLDRRFVTTHQAIQALFHTCTPPKQAVTNRPIALPAQPAGSKLKIRHTHQTLDIHFPPSSNTKSASYRTLHILLLILTGTILIPTGLFLFLTVVIGIFTGQLAMLFLTPIITFPLIISVGALFFITLVSLFENVQLHIDPSTITVTQTLLHTQRRRRLPRTDTQLSIVPEYPCIKLSTPNQTVLLPATTQQEIQWLTQLLGQWLERPA